jgi:hypothetical protein
MTLLAAFLEIVAAWRNVFRQSRTFRRAVRQALGSLVCLGRRCWNPEEPSRAYIQLTEAEAALHPDQIRNGNPRAIREPAHRASADPPPTARLETACLNGSSGNVVETHPLPH